jgi:putative ABC transport system ATP-binding protein
MGESGSGKSTLLNVMGFLHRISGGSYFLDGDDMSDVRDPDILAYVRNRKIGFIFQQFCLLSKLTVLENVGLPALYAGTNRARRETLAKELIRKVGLEDKTFNRPGQLSG